MLCLGVCAKEIHVCGEASAIELVKDLALSAGDEVEVIKYNRLTSLKVLDKSVGKQQVITFCIFLQCEKSFSKLRYAVQCFEERVAT